MAGDATRGLITSALLLIDRRPWGVRKLAEQRYIVIAKAVLGADINKIISKLQDAPNAKEGLRKR